MNRNSIHISTSICREWSWASSESKEFYLPRGPPSIHIFVGSRNCPFGFSSSTSLFSFMGVSFFLHPETRL
ncbi:hypothetical protein Dimus_025497 [Dionaea muscipula]